MDRPEPRRAVSGLGGVEDRKPGEQGEETRSDSPLTDEDKGSPPSSQSGEDTLGVTDGARAEPLLAGHPGRCWEIPPKGGESRCRSSRHC